MVESELQDMHVVTEKERERYYFEIEKRRMLRLRKVGYTRGGISTNE